MLNSFSVKGFTVGDKDLLSLTLNIWFGELFKLQTVRLIRLQVTDEGYEKYKEYVTDKLIRAKEIKAILYPSGQNRRVMLADIFYDRKNLNKELLESKLVKPFRRRFHENKSKPKRG